MEVNLLGTHQVVKAALDVGVERFVEFSTSEVYGPFIHKGKEDDLTTIGPIGESRWVYAASKLASEHLSYAHYQRRRACRWRSSGRSTSTARARSATAPSAA